MTTTEALRARLLAHAEIHDADLAHDEEQRQWAADLREAAAALSAAPATEALRLAREALTWLHDMAEGGKSVDHLYDGDCPDQLDRTRRDPACPACKAMDKARAALSAIDAAPATTGGSPEHLLQDQDRGLSRWLADKPDARLHAREAAAAIAAPSVEPVAPLNGIKATMFHDEGAIAQCGHCKRYTLDRRALSDRQPVCDCGKQHYWSGSFKKPGPDARWFGATPQAQPAAPKALTDEQIAWCIFEARKEAGPLLRNGTLSYRIARLAVAEFCRVNGITPQEGANG